MASAKRGRGRPKLKKEEIAEDYCFVCKDGGDLLICDYKQCLKAYHPYCVGKDKEFADSGRRWVCGWHSCFMCKKSATLHCFGCTEAVCQKCVRSAEFVHIKGKHGFCANCLNLALLATQNVDVYSDGGKIDFKDRNTYECLFKEYWEIINEKEGITLENLRSAEVLLKKGECYKDGSDLEGGEDDQDFDDSMDDNAEVDTISLMGKEPKVFSPRLQRKKSKPKKMEFEGWGSKVVRDFLKSIGKDSSTPISQNEVSEIIRKYIQEHKLTHPEKKKKVMCDTNLFSIFGRKSVLRNKISELLERHFAENLEESEEDELGYSPDEKNDDTNIVWKKQRTSLSRKTEEKKKVLETPQSPFASVTTNNIKLVYLKRSLVEDFWKNPETFDDKVMGAFVRVKSDPNDYFQKNEYQLLQVTGITKVQGTNNTNENVTLHVSSMRKGFQIRMLSEEDFSEEEVEDLSKRVKDGLLKKPMIVDLERKARSLHEDLTKHWIKKELHRLKNLSDRANEKGWRRELYEYMEQVKLLRTEAEQQRLLQEIPKVTAEEIEVEIAPPVSLKIETVAKDDSPRSILLRSDSMLDGPAGTNDADVGIGDDNDELAVDIVSPGIGNGANVNADMEVMQNSMEIEVIGENTPAKGIGNGTSVNADMEVMQNSIEIEVIGENTRENSPESAKEMDDLPSNNSLVPILSGQQGVMMNISEERGNNNSKKVTEVIELNSDDEDEVKPLEVKKYSEESVIWYYVGPEDGSTYGPFSMSMLRKWWSNDYFHPEFKVWKQGQSSEEAILLTDAFELIYH